MKLVFSENTLELVSEIVSLSQLRAVVNGVLIETPLLIERLSEHRYYASCFLPQGGSFHAEMVQEDEQRCSLWYWLETLPNDFVLDSFGLRFAQIQNLRAFLRSGYFSWDGSYYVEPEAVVETHAQGYALTQLLPKVGQGSVVLGFDRHDRFQQTFMLDSGAEALSLTVQTLWDRKNRHDLERCESERLVMIEYPVADHEAALRQWAELVAQGMHPRLTVPRISGWCSWYNLYSAINEENILDHLRSTQVVVEREHLPLWVFQIDDGFTPEMGDWLDVKPQFPRGMRPLLDDVRAAGFTPGLWIAPFMVGNRSRLYQQHPDWVVRDRRSNQPLAHMRFYGEFRWHKRSEEYYILDTTHPDAFEYLRTVFRTWRQEWGCDYFKTDFMHFGSEYGPDRAVWHQPGMSRIEIWRRTAEMIRAEIGDAVWLGCGCPLWASVGLVDGVRIGRDVGVQWSGEQSAQSLLRDQTLRNFANGILWQSDADCILLRDHFHDLTDTEVRSLALYAGMANSVVITSDKLDELSAERLELFKLLLPENSAKTQRLHAIACHFPLLGQAAFGYTPNADSRREWNSSDAVVVQVLAPPQKADCAAVFVLNTGNNPVTMSYPLFSLGLASPLYGYDWRTQTPLTEVITKIDVALDAHEGQLFFLANAPISAPPMRLAGA